MVRRFRLYCSLLRRSGTALEVVGLSLVVVGVADIYPLAALILIGGVLVFIAQGLDRPE